MPRPRPVPPSLRFVVKNGSKILVLLPLDIQGFMCRIRADGRSRRGRKKKCGISTRHREIFLSQPRRG